MTWLNVLEKKGKKKDNLSRIPSGKLSGTPAHICVYGLSKHYIELIWPEDSRGKGRMGCVWMGWEVCFKETAWILDFKITVLSCDFIMISAF